MYSLWLSHILFPSDLLILFVSTSENQLNQLLHLIFRGKIYHGMISVFTIFSVRPLLLELGIFLAFPVQYSFFFSSSFIKCLLRVYEDGVGLHL